MKTHVKLVVLILVVFAIVFAAVRAVVIPDSFGKYGHYRGDSLEENKNLPLVYSESSACKDCHALHFKDWSENQHKGVNCETCHGPALNHVESPTAIKPIAETSKELCRRCHAFMASRPSGFPQVDFETHNPGKKCRSCHNPHIPFKPWYYSKEV